MGCRSDAARKGEAKSRGGCAAGCHRLPSLLRLEATHGGAAGRSVLVPSSDHPELVEGRVMLGGGAAWGEFGGLCACHCSSHLNSAAQI